MSRFRLTLAAEEDVADIAEYLSERSRAAAENVLEEIEGACRLLGEHPGVGRHRDEIGHGVMSFPIGSYVSFYEDDQSGAVILRILHGHRDIPNAF